MKLRIGTGVDVHDLQTGEDLVLGGVKIPSDIGITGHSDGDLILHALVDSILGALAIGDIGQFFPSDDDKWKNADSKIFLDFALEKMKSYGFEREYTLQMGLTETIEYYEESLRSKQ